MNLKYLFKVEYVDGTKFKQNKNDVSSIDPKRSAFYDVLSSDKEIKTFEIGRVKVNLQDGHFEVKGQKLQIGDTLTPCKRKLIFYRQHQHDFNSGEKIETAHRVTYFIGWETKIGRKKYKEIIGIK